MEWLFILILGGVAYYLTERLGKAERRIEELSELQDRMFDYMRSANDDRRGEPVPDELAGAALPERPTSVPKVVLQRDRLSVADEASVAATPLDEPEPASQPVDEPSSKEPFFARFSFDLEDVFGRRLPIWAGGVTLAVAGVFLVRYSIERGH